MSLILSIESATSPGSVALHENGSLLSHAELHKKKSHAAKLPALIDNIIKSVDGSFSDLDAIAISGGPGSYTGLRIGAGLAKGLAFANDLPLIEVETLKIIAEAVKPFRQNVLYAPMIDARRMEVYTCLLDSNLNYLKETDPMILSEESFQNELKTHSIIFCGDGAEKAKNVIKNKQALFIDSIYPSARNMGELAFHKFKKFDFCKLDEWEPFYLKAFIAGKPKPLISQ